MVPGLQHSQISLKASRSPRPTRFLVICTSPREVISVTWCLVLSRPALGQPAQHQLPVELKDHVDEMDHDDPADVTQPKLADDLLTALEAVRVTVSSRLPPAPVYFPVLTSTTVIASVRSMTRLPPDGR